MAQRKASRKDLLAAVARMEKASERYEESIRRAEEVAEKHRRENIRILTALKDSEESQDALRSLTSRLLEQGRELRRQNVELAEQNLMLALVLDGLSIEADTARVAAVAREVLNKSSVGLVREVAGLDAEDPIGQPD